MWQGGKEIGGCGEECGRKKKEVGIEPIFAGAGCGLKEDFQIFAL